MRAIPSKEHFHIRWSGSELIDWERFDLYADAEAAANELVRSHESYVIQTFRDDACERCKSLYTAQTNMRPRILWADDFQKLSNKLKSGCGRITKLSALPATGKKLLAFV